MAAGFAAPSALLSAVTYGFADFAGGFAARRAPVLTVTVVAQIAGLVALLPGLLLIPGSPSVPAAWIGALAGLAGASGLLLYFRGLAVGPMGTVAPLSAVVAAGLPLLVGILGGERPGPWTIVGMLVALVAIVLATTGSRRERAALAGVLLGLASGAGFGLFFVILDATPADSGLWPLVFGRTASVSLLLVLTLIRRPGRPGSVWLMVASGVLDSAANVFFLLATRVGSLGVTSVIVALYPVAVVLLARAVLRERLTVVQLVSVVLAVGASVTLAGGG
ncbi:DMT family transporter [Pseudonocardia kujensis]|uniref:DMT family transporter n=1 Tax=Pseudonocardia kujensis TaxID=1128675 RepID=UPI001E5B378B|nr:DMT family transporter [Pseudonocardia kujensis]MCE0763202.1 DMT family transporter [Pseudonocardia kujensis]